MGKATNEPNSLGSNNEGWPRSATATLEHPTRQQQRPKVGLFPWDTNWPIHGKFSLLGPLYPGMAVGFFLRE